MAKITLAPSAQHNVLLKKVVSTGAAYVAAVQVAAVQAIGHALKTGDVTFGNKILETFTDGKSVGKSAFKEFMQQCGGFTSSDKGGFKWDTERRDAIGCFQADDKVIEGYMEELMALSWKDFKPLPVVSDVDLEKMVADAIKKFGKAQKENPNRAKGAALLKHLTTALATYHEETLNQAA